MSAHVAARCIVLALLLSACGEGVPPACRQVVITPTAGCRWISSSDGDLYVHDRPTSPGVFTICTEALSCADGGSP
jgi:hypothetical protein